jgi:serine protease Do
MWKERFRIRRGAATITFLVALVIGGLLGAAVTRGPERTVLGASAIVPARSGEHAINLGAFSNGFATVVKPALPAVVNISSSKIVKAQDNGPDSLFFNDPFFRQFFGDNFGRQFRPRSQREKSLGSGVIVSQDGYILTNNHVVNGANDVKVFLNDKREFQAKIIGTDEKTDVAVLKINATELPVLPIGNSSLLQTGDIVFAIGDPFGNLPGTVTMGIVSATGRSGLGIEAGGYEDFIQTDAAINPGNSGGALINLRGELVGINTAILTASGGNQGVGFAVPIDMARNVMNQILKHGKVIRGYLGVYIQNVTPELAKAFGIQENKGALVADVTPNSPAARAGIEKGDIILEVNGQPVEDINSLTLQISQTAPGTAVHLKVLHNKQTRDMTITLSELPEKNEQAGTAQGGGGALEGVQVETMTPDIARQLGLPALTKGVVITDIDPSSAAADAGLQRGDVIEEVNRKPVANVQEFRQALESGSKQSVLLLVNRGGTTSYVVIEAQ